MAAEALQILNLSPIPELSEVELSNALEQFSGLSELTGELTDRNVEDILREAEELLDMSSSIKEVSEEIPNDDSHKTIENPKGSEESDNKMQDYDSSIEKESKDSENKITNSPQQPLSARLKSPSDSKNHIKSAIDNLKEYSKIIEKQISFKSNDKKEERPEDVKKVPLNDIPEKLSKVKSNSPAQKNHSISGKLKHVERLNKAANVRKTFNDFKSRSSNNTNLKNKVQSKTIVERRKSSPVSSPIYRTGTGFKKKDQYDFLDFKDDNEIDLEKCIALLDKEVSQGNLDFKYPELAEQLLRHSKESVSMLQKEIADLKAQLIKDKVSEKSKWNSELEQKFWIQEDLISSLKEENAKLFQEIKEIKGQMKINAADQNLEKTLKEKQDVIENLRSEIESLRNCIKPNSSPGLSRLEEQFHVIKDKYNQQIEKLELENKQLKKAFHHDKNDVAGGKHDSQTFPKEIGVQTEKSPELKPTKLIRSTSFENWRIGKAKLWENVRSVENGGEAICQTERQKRNVSILSENFSLNQKKAENVFEPRKIDNKENVAAEIKKPVKPNLDLKGKKGMSEHENHLMATLRGLHADILAKDKENRKLKNEIESLKNQMKKCMGDAAKKKVQTKKKIHAGTQTIGLGPCVPAEYDPALFQVSKELENENEELKAKIRTLEEQSVQLKSKRVSDLQILHEIHEQEMAKLESKLESQTALAKHLHTLLLNR